MECIFSDDDAGTLGAGTGGLDSSLFISGGGYGMEEELFIEPELYDLEFYLLESFDGRWGGTFIWTLGVLFEVGFWFLK